MAESSIPVDLFNPGQVFACIGLVEAADVLLGDAEGAFDWRDASDVRFRIRAAGDEPPAERVLRFLEQADVFAEAPAASASIEKWTDRWGPRPREVDRALGYPFPDPRSPEVFVCVISDGANSVRVEHWGDATRRDRAKFWAGAGGYPGAARLRDVLSRITGDVLTSAGDPFGYRVYSAKKSSVRLDSRRDYIPIDLGFSLNEHEEQFHSATYPVVEVLGALGLSNSRPHREAALDYRYAVCGSAAAEDAVWLPLQLIRPALGGATRLPWSTRHFRALLGQPNEYDRTFTTVTEESSP